MQLEHLGVVEIAIFRINSPAANNCSVSGNKPFVGLENIPPIPRSTVPFILNRNVILYFSKRNASYLRNTWSLCCLGKGKHTERLYSGSRAVYFRLPHRGKTERGEGTHCFSPPFLAELDRPPSRVVCPARLSIYSMLTTPSQGHICVKHRLTGHRGSAKVRDQKLTELQGFLIKVERKRTCVPEQMLSFPFMCFVTAKYVSVQ